MIALKQVTLHGATIILGKGIAPRERFANDGPGHVVMLDFGMVALWDDRDPDADAYVIPVTRLKEMLMSKSELFKLLKEQGRMPEMNGSAPKDVSVAAQTAFPPSPLQPHPGPPATVQPAPGDKIPAALKAK